MVVPKKFSSPFLSFSALYLDTYLTMVLFNPKSIMLKYPTKAPINVYSPYSESPKLRMMKGVNINPIIFVRNILAYDNKAPFFNWLIYRFLQFSIFNIFNKKKNFCVTNGMAESRKANMETNPPTNP